MPNDEKKLLHFNQHLELQSNQAPQLCKPVNLSNCSESITHLSYPWYSNEMLGNIAQEPYKPYGTIGCLCATRRYFWNNSPNPDGFVTYGPVNTRIYDAYQDQFLNNRWNVLFILFYIFNSYILVKIELIQIIIIITKQLLPKNAQNVEMKHVDV